MIKTIIYTKLGLTYSDWEVGEKVKEFLESNYLRTIRVGNWNFIETLRQMVEADLIDIRNIKILSDKKVLVFTRQGSIVEKCDLELLPNSAYCLHDLEAM